MDLSAGSIGDVPGGFSIALACIMIIEFLVGILRFIVDMVFFQGAYSVGGFVMRIASFGSMRAAPIDVPYSEFNRFGCRRSGDGQIEVESTIAGGIGLVILCICFAVFLHFF